MESLFAKADAVAGQKRKRSKLKSSNANDDPHNTRHDHTLHSVQSHTKTPKSLASIPISKDVEVPTYTPTQIPSKKLRAKLHSQQTLSAQYGSHTEATQSLLELAAESAGGIQTTSPLEKTWRISQDEIASSIGSEAAKGRRELDLDGVRRMRWTRNGRHLVFIHGKGGTNVSSVDWLTGRVNGEVNLAVVNAAKTDTARDVCFLQDQSFWAVAQRRNVFVYDRDGVEIHKLGKIVDPVRLEFLPWHWLLVAVVSCSWIMHWFLANI
jgi:U3 small nucleolar RNA-associated protein 7